MTVNMWKCIEICWQGAKADASQRENRKRSMRNTGTLGYDRRKAGPNTDSNNLSDSHSKGFFGRAFLYLISLII